MFDPLSILAVFGPVAVDAGKALISRFLAPDIFKPANIDEYTKMRQVDLSMFTAMNNAGGANASYPWVEAVVRLMRPSIALTVIGTWAFMHFAGASYSDAALAMVDNFAASIGFYLFGDRTLFYSSKPKVTK